LGWFCVLPTEEQDLFTEAKLILIQIPGSVLKKNSCSSGPGAFWQTLIEIKRIDTSGILH